TKITNNFIEVIEPVPTPIANFSADRTVTTKDEIVTFNDLSSNTPESWNWIFEGGDPTTSTLKNPEVTFNSSGTFNVTLTVQNAAGTDTKTVENFMEVNEPTPAPVAEFSADNTVITEGENVNFTDLSTNTPNTWAWVFEGGTPATSSLKNPKVTYNASNKFKVTLTISNEAASDTKIIEDYIEVNAPPVPEYCTVSGNATDEWISSVKMGDNNSQTSGSSGYEDFTSVVFNFEAGKSYPITLTPGFSGRNKFEYWSVWIDFNGDLDFTDYGEQVFVTSKNRSTVSGSITIPEGITTDTRMRVAMGKSMPTDCGFIELGEVEDYTVHITEPVPQPPLADFIANRFSIPVGESIQFSDLSLNEPTIWQWSFPGGTPDISTEQNPTVVYNSIGEHDVTLIVSKNVFDYSKKIELNYISTTEDSSSEYCVPVAINSSNDFIESVSIENAINNSTLGNNYSLSDNTISMVSAKSYSVTLTPNLSTTRNFWKIWIDFNDDGDFDDSDETIFIMNNKKGSVTSNIIIPDYAKGNSRMRISMREKIAPNPCDDNYNGEVEDYLVSFNEPAASQFKYISTDARNFDTNNEFKIYPNPVSDKLNINLNLIELDDFYTIYNLNGKKISTNLITSTLTTIDITNYSNGMYLIVVVSKGKYYNQKFIKR
ncbi:MAG: PKD domain-containing protein, partial [Draconibacterium sp.]|nr:PKD domain-containing protein [Draconibacterium sp.]